MFSLRQTALRKITIDYSVKYISQSELTKDRDSKLRTIKNNSHSRDWDKKFSPNNKKLNKNISAGKFSIFKSIMCCYVSIKKRSDALIDQTKTKPQETLEFKMKKQMPTFSFSPPLNLFGEGKWLLEVIFFECTNFVFNVMNGNNSFSITIPGHWETKSAEKTIDELNNLLELWSQNGFELHLEQVRKRSVILRNDYSLCSLGTFKNEILEKLKKKEKYNDLEDLVYGF